MATNPCAESEPGGEAVQPLEPAWGQLSPTRCGRVHRRPPWLFHILTLTLIALGSEALFRSLFPIPEVVGFNRISYQMTAQNHPQLGKMMTRGLVYDRLLVESLPDGFSEIHGLNGYGFRGRDFAIAPSPGRRRILIIGDSVAEGMGAADSETIDRDLEGLLHRDGERAEVINLGVISASLAHDTLITRDAVALLHPADAVVVVYCNDLPAPPYESSFDRPGPSYPHATEVWWMPRVITMLGRYVHDQPICLRWPLASIRFFAPVPDGANPLNHSNGPRQGLDPALFQAMTEGKLNPWLGDQSVDLPCQLTHDFTSGGSPEKHLKRMQAACEAVGARLIIAYVPFCAVVSRRYVASLVKLGMDRATAEAMSVDPIYRRQNRILAQVCQSLGLPLVDATEDLVRADAAGTPQYWSFDTHPRPAGYATIAQCLHRALRDEGQ